jgi:hypothetical protein
VSVPVLEVGKMRVGVAGFFVLVRVAMTADRT